MNYVSKTESVVIPEGHVVAGIVGDGETEHEIPCGLVSCFRKCVCDPKLWKSPKEPEIKECIEKLIQTIEDGIFGDNSQLLKDICKKLETQIEEFEKLCTKFESSFEADEELLKCIEELKEVLKCEPVDFTGFRTAWSSE